MDVTSGRAPGTMELVALGDSLTEGVGDPHGRRLHGWIHHLTQPPAPWRLSANLARTGARAAHVRREQLATAVALAPAVATCVVGVNDVLDRRFDAGRFAVEYEALVGGLREAAHVGVLAMTLHDLSEGLPLTRRARTSLRSRTAAANKVIEEVAGAHGAWLLEAREAVAFRGAGMLSVDRLHPNRRGHRYLAACAAEVLRGEGRVQHTAGPPAADPLGLRLRATGGHLRWLARHLAGSPR